MSAKPVGRSAHAIEIWTVPLRSREFVRQWVYLDASQGNIVHFHCPGTPSKQLFSAAPLFSPISLSEMQRSFYGPMLTWFASQESKPLFSLSQLLTAIPSEPLPTLPVVPVPSCALKLPILLGSVGSPAELLQNR
jgi:hypothetical protein